MRRTFLALVPLAAFAGCNCGKPVVTTTMGSIALTSELLEFGIVPEGTSKGGRFRIDNNGRAPVNLGVQLVAGGSADFALGAVPASVEPGGFVEVPVVFTPMGPGEDEGFAEVSVPESEEMPLRVRLHGGPIFPALGVTPDPVDFRPSTMSLERRMVTLRSDGTSALTINAIGVAGNGNPDFSVVPPTLPTRLLPGESVAVRVEYARSVRTTEGMMEILSDDADAGLRRVRLIPDPPAACADQMDNDGDGLSDFPNDPSCQDAADTDEYNPTQCVSGATQPCGGTDGGFCAGMRSCVNGMWGNCSGFTMPVAETCNNMDDDCNGQVDNGVTRACYTGAMNTRGVGNCRDGQEACSQGVFGGACMNQVLPSTEVCGNTIDEDCNGVVDACDAGVVDAGMIDAGVVDAGMMACNPNGSFRLDAGTILYGCCDFGLGPTVQININTFTIESAASAVRPTPEQPVELGGDPILVNPSPAASCPAGSFTYSRVLPGGSAGCTETYTLTGAFVGPNTFVGTYSATFVGPQCAGSFCSADPCTSQTWNISAGR